MKVREWDDLELGKLVRLYTDRNVDVEEIVAQLPGRTETAIRLKASRLGLHREDLTILRISELNWTIHEKGDRILIVASHLNLSESVRRIMESNGEYEATGYEDTMPQVTIKKVF